MAKIEIEGRCAGAPGDELRVIITIWLTRPITSAVVEHGLCPSDPVRHTGTKHGWWLGRLGRNYRFFPKTMPGPSASPAGDPAHLRRARYPVVEAKQPTLVETD